MRDAPRPPTHTTATHPLGSRSSGCLCHRGAARRRRSHCQQHCQGGDRQGSGGGRGVEAGKATMAAARHGGWVGEARRAAPRAVIESALGAAPEAPGGSERLAARRHTRTHTYIHTHTQERVTRRYARHRGRGPAVRPGWARLPVVRQGQPSARGVRTGVEGLGGRAGGLMRAPDGGHGTAGGHGWRKAGNGRGRGGAAPPRHQPPPHHHTPPPPLTGPHLGEEVTQVVGLSAAAGLAARKDSPCFRMW